MQDQVVQALEGLFERYRRRYGRPLAEYLAGDDSPAALPPAHDGRIGWRPFRRPSAGSFDNVGRALEMPVHPALAGLFGHYFAGNLPLCFKGLFLTLLQPWNQDDFERLQQNQIGHQLMQRKLGLAPTWFIASCRDEQRLVTLDNAGGAVWLERLGEGRIGVLAPDLAGFLRRAEPMGPD